jgi:2-iminobutanoate/2-iminopropanoate deaminase
MKKTIVSTNNAPKAVGPYSQAVAYNGLVYTSGTMPLDPNTGAVVDGGIQCQAKQALDNLSEVLKEAGSCIDNVIKTTVFIKDMNDFSIVNEIYSNYFKTDCPSRSCVEVARLPKDVLFEIECIAICK